MSTYQEFLARKAKVWHGAGVAHAEMPAKLFPWQAAITRWALKKGRAAIFADCGLGKSFMQLAWAQAIDGPVLILAPLCVAEQTVREAAKLGLMIRYAQDQSQATTRIVITNYERLDKFDVSRYRGVVLDESSILKSFDGQTRTRLIATFKDTPYRLCCTATPSPNDIAELANHAEFLGLQTRPEFLASWFVHDDAGWRMKGHAVTPFFRWLASWAMAVRRPSDLGSPDDGFVLPALTIQERIIEGVQGATLFPELGAKGLKGRLMARLSSLDARIAETVRILSDHPREQFVVWCGLNDEADAIAAAVPDAINVEGSDSYAEKTSAVEAFLSGQCRVLVSKIKILGFGMNFQHCHRMIFVGLGDSYEQYYQGIRRCWRFGQSSPVTVDVVVSEAEQIVVTNVRRKEQAASHLSDRLLAHMNAFEREELSA